MCLGPAADPGELSRVRAHAVIGSLEDAARCLVCNSVDAGATEIVLKVDLSSLSVCCHDNGTGVEEAEMPLLCRRHYSSKHSGALRKSDTRGSPPLFSGESLYAVGECSASMAVLSKTEGGSVCRRVFPANRVELSAVLTTFFGVSLDSPSGTIVMASRMFWRVPVRRRYARNRSREQAVRALRIALFDLVKLCTAVSVLLHVRDHAAFELVCTHEGTCTPKSLVCSLFGLPLSSVQGVAGTDDCVSMEGAVGCGSPFLQRVSVDGLDVELSVREKSDVAAILRSYGLQKCRQGVANKAAVRRPMYVLQMRSQAGENRCWKDLFASLKTLLVSSLERQGYTRTTVSQQARASFTMPSSSSAETGVISMLDLAEGRFTLVGQLWRRVVLVSARNTLYALDQHACDERIHLEDSLREYIENTTDPRCNLCVQCTEPVLFAVLAEQAADFAKYAGVFLQFGFRYAVAAESVTVTHGPSLMAKFDRFRLGDCLCEHISHLKAGTKTLGASCAASWFSLVKNLPSVVVETLISGACRLSVKFGDVLTEMEMNYLVTRLGRCHLPHQCAHGRPTIVVVSGGSGGMGFHRDEVV